MASVSHYLHFACSCGAKYAAPLSKAPADTFRVPCQRCRAPITIEAEGRVISEKAYPLLGVPPRGE